MAWILFFSMSGLAEEGAEGFFDLADGNEFDVELLAVEGDALFNAE